MRRKARARGEVAVFGDMIVPLDGSDRSAVAIRPASAIARFLDTKVKLIALANPGEEDEVRGWVGRQARLLGGVSVEARVETRTDSIGVHLAQIFDESPNDLVCMSTHGRGRAAAVMGSVASELLERTDRPILLIGPSYDEHRFRCRGSLLATVDGSHHSEAIVPAVEAFASTFGFDVTFTTVVDPRGAMAAQAPGASGSEAVIESTYVHRIAARAQATIGRPVQFEVLHRSKPAEAIIEYAESLNAALIAMATHGASGLRRALAGSMTASVVRNAPCPVLAVRPMGPGN